MRRRNPYADLSALLDATRKLTDEEMAELQLELGYTERALLIYEQLLRAEPRNAFYRRRCEWLARLVMANQPTVCRSAERARPRATIRARVEPASPAAVRPQPIITVGH